MLRTTIRASGETEVDAVLSDLDRRCRRSGLSPDDASRVLQRVADVLTPLVARSRTLGSQGSVMEVRQDIAEEKVSIRIIFRSTPRISLASRIRKLLGGRA